MNKSISKIMQRMTVVYLLETVKEIAQWRKTGHLKQGGNLTDLVGDLLMNKLINETSAYRTAEDLVLFEAAKRFIANKKSNGVPLSCEHCDTEFVCKASFKDDLCTNYWCNRLAPKEMFSMDKDALIDRLEDCYDKDCLAVAKVCDDVLDKSGGLLGQVRERHAKIRGTL